MKKCIVLLLVMAMGITGFAQTVTPVATAPKKHKKHVVVKKRVEKVVINDKEQKTVVEVKNGMIYVDGSVVSTIKDAKSEDHKIVINHKGGHKAKEADRSENEKEVTEHKAAHHPKGMRHMLTPSPGLSYHPDVDSEGNGSVTFTFSDGSPNSFQRDAQSGEGHGALLGVYTSKNIAVEGAYVERVITNTPAENAGLTTGDVITKVNETPIRSSEDLVNTIASYQPGDIVIIDYIRDGNNEQVRVPLGSKEPQTAESGQGSQNRFRENQQWENNDMPGGYYNNDNNNNGGYNNSGNNGYNNDYRNEDGSRYGYNGRYGRVRKPVRLGISASDGHRPKGVYLDEVKTGGAAEAAGLQKGDIITRINGERVKYAYEMEQLLSLPGIGNVIVIDFKHNGAKMHTEVHVQNEQQGGRHHYSHMDYNYGRD